MRQLLILVPQSSSFIPIVFIISIIFVSPSPTNKLLASNEPDSTEILFSIYQQDIDLDLILKEAKARQEAIRDFRADFEYSMNFPRESRPTIHGFLIYQSGKYVVKLPDQDVFCDGDARWYYLKDLKEVIIKDYEEEIGITMPFQVFNKGKSPRYSGSEQLGDTLCDVIFFDKMSESAYQRAKVWIDKETRIVQKIVLLFENQGSYTFNFKNIKINQGYSASTFKFPLKNYPGVNVVDERMEK